MKESLRKFIILAAASIFLSGCAATVVSSVGPNTDLKSLKNFYVVRSPDDNRGVDTAIQLQLASMGLKATSGTDFSRPKDVDVIVTYKHNWVWDITWYLLDLIIQFRDPQTNVLIASGQSYRSSLVRREPAFMAKEVLDSIFKTGS